MKCPFSREKATVLAPAEHALQPGDLVVGEWSLSERTRTTTTFRLYSPDKKRCLRECISFANLNITAECRCALEMWMLLTLGLSATVGDFQALVNEIAHQRTNAHPRTKQLRNLNEILNLLGLTHAHHKETFATCQMLQLPLDRVCQDITTLLDQIFTESARNPVQIQQTALSFHTQAVDGLYHIARKLVAQRQAKNQIHPHTEPPEDQIFDLKLTVTGRLYTARIDLDVISTGENVPILFRHEIPRVTTYLQKTIALFFEYHRAVTGTLPSTPVIQELLKLMINELRSGIANGQAVHDQSPKNTITHVSLKYGASPFTIKRTSQKSLEFGQFVHQVFLEHEGRAIFLLAPGTCPHAANMPRVLGKPALISENNR